MCPDKDLEQTRPSGPRRTRGLVSNRASGARVHAQRYPVPAELEGVIETVWTGWWDLRGQEDHVTELLSDPCVNLVFERSGQAGADQARVVGVWTRLWIRRLSGTGRVWGLKLRPGAVRALLPEPAHTYRDRHTPLDEPELLTQVLDAPGDDQAVDALVRWACSRSRPEASSLAVAVMEHALSSELTRVDQLALHAGLSVRGLQRLFREHVGASPKWVLRRARLQEAAVRVEHGGAQQLADLAYELGYADQAHLARDFRAATGRTLTRFSEEVWPPADP